MTSTFTPGQMSSIPKVVNRKLTSRYLLSCEFFRTWLRVGTKAFIMKNIHGFIAAPASLEEWVEQ